MDKKWKFDGVQRLSVRYYVAPRDALLRIVGITKMKEKIPQYPWINYSLVVKKHTVDESKIPQQQKDVASALQRFIFDLHTFECPVYLEHRSVWNETWKEKIYYYLKVGRVFKEYVNYRINPGLRGHIFFLIYLCLLIFALDIVWTAPAPEDYKIFLQAWADRETLLKKQERTYAEWSKKYQELKEITPPCNPYIEPDGCAAKNNQLPVHVKKTIQYIKKEIDALENESSRVFGKIIGIEEKLKRTPGSYYLYINREHCGSEGYKKYRFFPITITYKREYISDKHGGVIECFFYRIKKPFYELLGRTGLMSRIIISTLLFIFCIPFTLIFFYVPVYLVQFLSDGILKYIESLKQNKKDTILTTLIFFSCVVSLIMWGDNLLHQLNKWIREIWTMDTTRSYVLNLLLSVIVVVLLFIDACFMGLFFPGIVILLGQFFKELIQNFKKFVKGSKSITDDTSRTLENKGGLE